MCETVQIRSELVSRNHRFNTGCANRLAIDDTSARLRVAADAYAELLTQHGVEPLPRAVHAPPAEIVIRGLPRREFVREQPPGTAAPHHVEDGIQDVADRMEPRPANGLGWGQKRAEPRELSIR